MFISIAACKGWHIDNTSDLARVLRVPGTFNHKNEPTPVTLHITEGPDRYTPEEIEKSLEGFETLASEPSIGTDDQILEGTRNVTLTSIAGFYMAWNIGANDVANSMGTSVGSKVITVRQAVILAAVLNILGAVLVGSHVTNTVRKGIIDPAAYEANPELFIYGMFSAILAAGMWVTFATHLRLPVSTTHSVVGAIVGFGFISAGFSVINYTKLISIVLSWIVSPVAGGIMAFILFSLISKIILNADEPYEAAKKLFPFIVSLVFIVLSLAVMYKGMHIKLENQDIIAKEDFCSPPPVHGAVPPTVSKLRDILEKDKKNIDVLFALGCVYLRGGEFKDAEDCFQKALKLNEESAELRCNLAVSLAAQEKFDDSLTEIKKGLLLQPAGPTA